MSHFQISVLKKDNTTKSPQKQNTEKKLQRWDPTIQK